MRGSRPAIPVLATRTLGMRRPRARIWMMMVAVAVVTIPITLVERHHRFKTFAAAHFPRSGGLGVRGIGGACRTAWDRSGQLIDPSDDERFERELGWHRELWGKYEH